MEFYNRLKEYCAETPVFLPTQRKISFFITCGLPGTGKTTFCEKIKNYYPENEAIILSRDYIRGNILWQIRKKSKEEQKTVIENLDFKVTEELVQIITSIREEYEEFQYKAIIIDGCHTNWKTLTSIILAIGDIKNKCNIYLCIIGDNLSQCCHNVTYKEEGDYSDYKEDFTHDSVPECVIKKKRNEMELLLTKYLEFISYYVDAICMYPAYSK